MTNCIFVTATLFQTLAFIATGIAFFAPFWREEGQTGTGLWGTCTSSECTWFWEDNYTWGKELTGSVSLLSSYLSMLMSPIPSVFLSEFDHIP